MTSLRPTAGRSRATLAEGSFRVHADRTGFVGWDLQRIVEPANIGVLVGTPASEPPCRVRARLTGPVRKVVTERSLVTPVDVCPIQLSVEEF